MLPLIRMIRTVRDIRLAYLDTLAANQVNGVGLIRSPREYVQMLLHVLFATIPHSPTDPTQRWEP